MEDKLTENIDATEENDNRVMAYEAVPSSSATLQQVIIGVLLLLIVMATAWHKTSVGTLEAKVQRLEDILVNGCFDNVSKKLMSHR